MAAVDSTFSERLNEAFTFRGITTPPEKINRLTAATGCTSRTVKRWLSGASMPCAGPALSRIARDLDIDTFWLYDGQGMSPFEFDMTEKLAQMPKEWVPKFTRYCLRLLNDDPKAKRWAAMHERGELRVEQILAMA